MSFIRFKTTTKSILRSRLLGYLLLGAIFALLWYFYCHNFRCGLIYWNDLSLSADLSFTNNSISTKTIIPDIKILCWILTAPQNYKTKAIAVNNTWGKRCDKLLLMSSANDENPGIIPLPKTLEGREYLWGKTKEAFKYIWKHHMNDADWFMKADDDTFVVVENLRQMLQKYDTNDPIWLGTKLKYQNSVPGGYMAGGPGYVLSKEAVRRFVEEALPNGNNCTRENSGKTIYEDVEMGKCLDSVGVEGVDTRDNLGRYRFMIFTPEEHVNNVTLERHQWYWRRMYFSPKPGLIEKSDQVISFHYVTPRQMYTLDYLIYHLKP